MDRPAHMPEPIAPRAVIPVTAPFLACLFIASLLPTGLKLPCFFVMCALATLSLLPQFHTEYAHFTPLILAGSFGFLWSFVRCDLLSFVPEADIFLSNLLSDVRYALSSVIQESVGGTESALVSAMLLGVRDTLPTSLIQQFSRLGISHILAISGLHLSILAGSLLSLLCLCGVSRRTALIASASFAVLFCALCGFPFSLMRAMLMYVLFCMAQLIGRDNTSAVSLCLAGTVICLLSPSAISSISFQMSFLATLGILCLSYPLTEQCVSYFHGRISRACVRYLGGMLVSTFAANLFLFPVYILQLHSFAPAGLLVNFLFLPLSTVLLYTAPFVLLLYPVPVLGHAAASLCRTIAALFLHLVDSLDASIGLAVPMDLPFVPYLCTLLVCASVLYCLRFRPGIGLILIFAACCGLYLLCTVLSAV